MSKLTEDQQFDNTILYQRISLIFKPAANWETCTMPLNTHDMIEKVMEEQGPFFDSEALVILVMEEMNFEYALNEFNQKRYWLLNPA